MADPVHAHAVLCLRRLRLAAECNDADVVAASRLLARQRRDEALGPAADVRRIENVQVEYPHERGVSRGLGGS